MKAIVPGNSNLQEYGLLSAVNDFAQTAEQVTNKGCLKTFTGKRP